MLKTGVMHSSLKICATATPPKSQRKSTVKEEGIASQCFIHKATPGILYLTLLKCLFYRFPLIMSKGFLIVLAVFLKGESLKTKTNKKTKKTTTKPTQNKQPSPL